jgi:apolipoprotein N-acyltransferase
VGPDGKLVGVYYKVHLVPFGEFVPGRDQIPFIDKFPIMPDDRSSGPGYHTLHTRKDDLGVMICFESTFPQIAGQFVRNGADTLFIITNDSWFKKTAAVAQHHDCSILRAVETRRYVARNATTGITSLIEPTGRVLASAGLGKRAVVRGKVAMMDGLTIYTALGDLFAYLCMVFGLLVVSVSLIRPYKTKGHSR